MHLLALYKTQWHFSLRKSSTLLFSFPCPKHPWAEGPSCPNLLRTCPSPRGAQGGPVQYANGGGITLTSLHEKCLITAPPRESNTPTNSSLEGEQPLTYHLQEGALRKPEPVKNLPWYCHCIFYSGEAQLPITAGAPGEELALVAERHAVRLSAGHMHDVLSGQGSNLL